MLEDPIDKMGGSSIMIQGHELAIWEQLMFSLQVLDVWHAPLLVHTKSSRPDRHLNGINLSRLDRFYVSNKFLSFTTTIHILPRTSFSDHAPVVLSVSNRKF